MLGRRALKAEAPLNFDNAARQSTLGSAEKRVLYVRARTIKVEWLQIQQIENIEKVGPYFKGGALLKKATQAELLTNRHIDVKVIWATERVSADARQLETDRRDGAEKGCTAARKVGTVDEGIVRSVVARPAAV